MSTADVEARDGEHTLVRRFGLFVIDGPDAKRRFSSTSERVVIGTHESADLQLADETVSRFHCELTVTRGKVMVRDLDSRNGTEVDGVRVGTAWLKPNAILELGRTRMRFVLGVQDLRVPLSANQQLGLMVGRSTAMRALFATVERVASTDATVLIEGDTGTGKEALAETLHQQSERRHRPFVVIDCAAIPPDLLESELFGHEKGAFTGAVAERTGAFESAGGGTLFLDELGELPLDLQPKLLRAIEQREFKRVGANGYRPTDVRLIAATNRSLRAEVNGGRFRSDLYYRVAVVELRLPPLRERLDDLPLLVDHMLARMNLFGRPETEWLRKRPFLDELGRHGWPGNVRELRNYLERCLALKLHAPIAPGEAQPPPEAQPQTLRHAREQFERHYLARALREHDDNVTAAARASGVDRAQFYRLLWRHHLR